jgi:hypothetical protein
MDYEAILNEAQNAATAAIRAKFDKGDEEQPYNCGFAWVTISGTEALARHCRNLLKGAGARSRDNWRRYGDKGEPRGWQWWAPGAWPTKEEIGRTVYGQDMDFKRAGAQAFADVLAKYGIRATVSTRLD